MVLLVLLQENLLHIVRFLKIIWNVGAYLQEPVGGLTLVCAKVPIIVVMICAILVLVVAERMGRIAWQVKHAVLEDILVKDHHY